MMSPSLWSAPAIVKELPFCAKRLPAPVSVSALSVEMRAPLSRLT